MASLVLSGDTSGSITVSAPAVAGSTTQTLVNVTGTLAPIVSGTAQASTSGTSIDFTGIPSWVKRITVMFSGVSTNGTSPYLIQIGAGSVTTSGYASCVGNRAGETTSTAGFIVTRTPVAADAFSGNIFICSSGSNGWVESSTLGITVGGAPSFAGGNVTLGGTLDRVRITTVNGTDTFDAGSINILYE
jgi:hypothetical protein